MKLRFMFDFYAQPFGRAVQGVIMKLRFMFDFYAQPFGRAI